MSKDTRKSAEPWYGNQDAEKEYPQYIHGDKKNYVLVRVPTKKIQHGKNVQLVEAKSLARTQVFLPDVYEKFRSSEYFEKDQNCIWRVLHDPEAAPAKKKKAAPQKPQTPSAGNVDPEASAPKQTDLAGKANQAPVGEDKEAKAPEADQKGSTNDVIKS